MNTCPFCNLAPRIIVLEKTPYSKIFFSNPRLMPGHLLVTPHRHVQKLSQLTLPEREDLMELTIKYQDRILDRLAPGCDVSQHCRPFIIDNPVAVPGHLHIHLRPRTLDDKLWRDCQQYEKFEPVADEEMNMISAVLHD